MSFYVYDIVKKINSIDSDLYVISDIDSNGDSYAIRNLETGGGSAWWNEKNFELIGRAERDIFEKLDKKREEIIKRDQDLKYIKEHFPKLSSTSWLYLFKKIGYNSSFYKSGEYFILDCEVQTLYPIFKALFDNDIDKALKNLLNAFQPSYLQEYRKRILDFYEELKGDNNGNN